MKAYVVIKEILNVRSSASDQSDENFVGELLKGEIVYLKDEEIIGEVPMGGTSNIWKPDSNNNLVAIEGVRPLNYEEKKRAFIENPDCAKFIDLSDKTNESKWKVNWGFVDLEIWKIWKEYKTMGEGIKVAILDSGLNYDHEDFKNNPNINFYNAVENSILKKDCLDNDSTKHGTECAGILCGQGKIFYGIAPKASITIIRITDEDANRTTEGILNGLKKAIELEVDVISLSFFMANDANFKLIHEKIKDAYNKNITICAAAGNSGASTTPVVKFPASFPECFSIGGVTKSQLRSTASNKSETLCTMAPGEELRSMLLNTKFLKGTSYSTPLIAGIISLLKSYAKKKNKSFTNNELLNAIKITSDRSMEGYDIIDYGYGVIVPKALFNNLTT